MIHAMSRYKLSRFVLFCAFGVAAACFPRFADAASSPIKLCFVDDLSGAAADTGKLSLEGIELAIENFNSRNRANGRVAELVKYDGKVDPVLSATLAQRCAEEDDALVILGGDTTAGAAAMIPIAESSRLPLFILGATADRLTQPTAPFAFRFGPNSTQEADSTADLLAKQGFRRVAIVACGATSAIDYQRAVVAALNKRSIPIVAQQTYDINAVDLAPQLANIRDAHPDALVVIPYPADGARVLRTARQLDLSIPTVVIRTALMETLRKLAGEASVGVVTPNTVDTTRADVKAFFDNLNDRFGKHQPTPYSVISYDAANIALAIASRSEVQKYVDSGNLNAARQRFRDDIEYIGTFPALQGRQGSTYRFISSNHQGIEGKGWYVYAEVAEKGTRLIPADLDKFVPKR